MFMCNTGETLKPAYQQTLSYKLYEGFLWLNKDNRLKPVATFVFMLFVMEVLKGTGLAAFGLSDDGSLDETKFDDDGTAFVSNIRKAVTLVQVLGSIVAGAGIVFTFLQYRNEEQPQRAQALAVRGFVALFVINIVVSIINFGFGAFDQ